MKRSGKIWLSITFCMLLVKSAFAAPADSTSYYVQQLLHPATDSARTLAITKLAASRKPETFPLLTAINDKSLCLYQNQPATLVTKEDSELGDLYLLYPDLKAVTDQNGKPKQIPVSDLEEIKISRTDRLLLSDITALLNIFSADPKKRLGAYSQLEPSQQNALLLDKALAKETDPEALRAGKEVYYNILILNAKTPELSKLYIDSLTANWGDNATSILAAYAKNTALKPEVRQYALEKEAELNKQYDYLQKAQNFFSGLSLGSILILIALGLSIVYGLAGIINMAHGEFLMIGAYTTYCVQILFKNTLGIENGDLFFLFSLPVSFLMAGVWGLVLERLVIRHLYAKPLESLLATWGVSLILIQTARSLFGDLTAVKTPEILSGGWQILPHLVLPYNRMFIIILTLVIVLLTYLMLYRSRLGIQIRAVTQNRNMSSCLGIETKRVDAITFFLGSGLAGLAGCAMTLIGNVVPDMGQTYIVDSFLVVVTGGVGKLAGTIVSGLGIGSLTKVFEAFFEAVYGKVLILALIMLFMQYKPKGLFPDKGRIAED